MAIDEDQLCPKVHPEPNLEQSGHTITDPTNAPVLVLWLRTETEAVSKM
jgi:hypothetical protein